MDDTRLLELAGIAAGETYGPDRNPLERDDLALRLAVKTHQLQNNRWMRHLNLDDYKKDPYAATRRAIVRAAAAIGAAIGAEK